MHRNSGTAKNNERVDVFFVAKKFVSQLKSNTQVTLYLAKKFYRAGKITAAICVSPKILALAGILDGKRATAWSGVKDELISLQKKN